MAFLTEVDFGDGPLATTHPCTPSPAKADGAVPAWHTVSIRSTRTNAGIHRVEELSIAAERWQTRLELMRDRVHALDGEISIAARELATAKEHRAMLGQRNGVIDAKRAILRGYERKLCMAEDLLRGLRRSDDALAGRHERLREDVNHLRLACMEKSRRIKSATEELRELRGRIHGAAIASIRSAQEQSRSAIAAEAVSRLSNYERNTHQKAIMDLQASIVGIRSQLAVANRPTPQDENEGPGSGNLTEEQEDAARARIIECDEGIIEHETVIRRVYAVTKQLQQVFRTMVAHARLRSLRHLIDWFAEEEAFKYQMHAFVQHLLAEAKAVKDRIDAVKRASARTRAELASHENGETCLIAERQKELEDVRAEIDHCQRVVEQYNGSLVPLSQMLAVLYLRSGGADTCHVAECAAFARAHVPATLRPTELLDTLRQSAADAGLLVPPCSNMSAPIRKDEMVSVLGHVEAYVSNFATLFAQAAGHPRVRQVLIALHHVHKHAAGPGTSRNAIGLLHDAAWCNSLLQRFIVSRWPGAPRHTDDARLPPVQVRAPRIGGRTESHGAAGVILL